MKTRSFVFLTVVARALGGTCEPDAPRTDCGHMGSTQASCEAKGCCWSPTTADRTLDTPWCFYKTGPSPPTPPAPAPSGPCLSNNRTDCKIGDKDGCLGAGCCWSPAIDKVGQALFDTPWCFYHSGPSPACSTNPPCSGHGQCTEGSCKCSAGFASCGPPSKQDCSINFATDKENCGRCGNKCASGPGVSKSVCAAGACAVTCESGYKLCFGDCVKTDDCSKIGPYSPSEVATFTGYFMDNLNVNGSGAVMASPSHSNPNYYYHWQRDAALSMDILQHSGGNSTDPSKFDDLMKLYVGWIHRAQTKKDNNCDVRGEPKFMLDGTGDAYPGGWMRPQNDGSALRTVATINFAIRRFHAGDVAYAKSLFPAIQNDLAYVTAQWNQPSGDLWEEVKGDLFFTKMCQRKGLVWGAKFATLIGETGAALAYAATAKTMEASIEAHWNPNSSWGAIYMEMAGQREMDSAIYLGILYGNTGDGFISPSSDKAQSSMAAYIASMTDKGKYSFAVNDLDDAAGIPGVLTGRYPQDHYQGSNPWILCSQAVGRFYYENAKELAATRVVNVTTINQQFYEQLLQHAQKFPDYAMAPSAHVTQLTSVLKAGNVLAHADDPQLFRSMMRLLVGRGDGQLLRVKHHIKGNNFHMPEQLSGADGSSVSAIDLTWSYGTAIAALTSRREAMEVIAGL